MGCKCGVSGVLVGCKWSGVLVGCCKCGASVV